MGYLAGLKCRHPKPRGFPKLYRSLNLQSPQNPLRFYYSATPTTEPLPESTFNGVPVLEQIIEVPELVGSGSPDVTVEELKKQVRVLRGQSPRKTDKCPEGITPTRHTYNIMLWGFFLSEKIETVNRFYEDMIGCGVVLDVVTYNTMIHGFYRTKRIEEAEKFFVEMKGKNIPPTVISYTTMIKGYVSAGKVDDALRMFDEIDEFGVKPNTVTYTTLLPGIFDAMKMAEAKKILKEMVVRYTPPKDNSIFTRLLEFQCKSGDMDVAVDVLKSMISLSIPTEVGHYGVLIENFCKSNLYERVEKLLDKIIEKEIILR